MIAKLVAALILAAVAGPAFSAETARVVYLGLQDDPYYEPQRVYTGLSLKDRNRPLDGVRLAFRGTRILTRAIGIEFELQERLLGAEELAGAVRAAGDDGAIAVLLDLPADRMESLLATGSGNELLFNIRDGADRWRGADCNANLLHTMPSRSMLTDAMAQYLRFRRWTRILLLSGDALADGEEADAIRRSTAKFGLKIVADRDFVLTNDPRRRDLSNIALLTGPPAHDVIWLADAEGEFGRYVPYATYSPRPVVGAEGLSAVAWHWTWERHGAPQLNQRFRRIADRDMQMSDWAGWAAGQTVIEAVTKSGSTNPGTIVETIRSEEFAIDLYKGVRGSFRRWNGQLRQPILLATHNAVIASAPLEGFEHQVDTLDTLGFDEAESPCLRR
ncbi:amino acid ABC transporter substrate-binding protein [Oricola cellulosilytica]|uniref:Amino acid ABC transporter substrate-binding protein n=1 Tax=Oricola cellulosilytica TaxID=1429082 RepID=A0A4V2MP48_9HYPH|nr:amino acid ABC transporter substrate-binding protein [Oricola cellulosilytica]TCD16282.1 amino acid ABC transporter substrate-binding protein [Oricola cellulosilytica]